MSLLLRCLLPLSVSVGFLVSCQSPRTLPEPAEFSLSAVQLKRGYSSQRQLGIVTLHAPQISTVKDEQGAEAYLATGGALLVKNSVPAIIAKAPEILLTNDAAELRGRSVVKKSGLLYTGDAEGSKVIIDGVMLSFVGPHSTGLPGPAVKSEVKPVAAVMPAVVKPVPARPVVSKPKPKPAPPQVAPKPAAVKPASPKPAPAKQPAPLDRSRAFQLMREPGEG